MKSSKTNSPTAQTGAKNLPPIGDSFMYIEASSNKHGEIVFVFFSKRLILYKLVIEHSIKTNFQF